MSGRLLAMTHLRGRTMLISKSNIAIVAVILTYSLSSQALIGALLPGKPGKAPKNEKQAEQEQPFFDNRHKKQKPKKDKPAPSKVIMHKPTYQGSGCPQGSASAAMSTDNRAVSIVFDQFTTEASAQANKQTTEKTCRLIIPIEAPQGYRMAVAQMDYRGFKSLPVKARAKLVAVHQIRHQLLKVLGPKVKSQQMFEGPNSEDFYMSAILENKPVVNLQVPILDPVLNPILKTCGGLYNLEIDASIAVMTNPTGEQAMITLDSVDSQLQDGSVAYHLQWEQCQ